MVKGAYYDTLNYLNLREPNMDLNKYYEETLKENEHIIGIKVASKRF